MVNSLVLIRIESSDFVNFFDKCFIYIILSKGYLEVDSFVTDSTI